MRHTIARYFSICTSWYLKGSFRCRENVGFESHPNQITLAKCWDRDLVRNSSLASMELGPRSYRRKKERRRYFLAAVISTVRALASFVLMPFFHSLSLLPMAPSQATFFSNHSSHCFPEKLELIPFSTTPSNTTVGVT